MRTVGASTASLTGVGRMAAGKVLDIVFEVIAEASARRCGSRSSGCSEGEARRRAWGSISRPARALKSRHCPRACVQGVEAAEGGRARRGAGREADVAGNREQQNLRTLPVLKPISRRTMIMACQRAGPHCLNKSVGAKGLTASRRASYRQAAQLAVTAQERKPMLWAQPLNRLPTTIRQNY